MLILLAVTATIAVVITIVKIKKNRKAAKAKEEEPYYAYIPETNAGNIDGGEVEVDAVRNAAYGTDFDHRANSEGTAYYLPGVSRHLGGGKGEHQYVNGHGSSDLMVSLSMSMNRNQAYIGEPGSEGLPYGDGVAAGNGMRMVPNWAYNGDFDSGHDEPGERCVDAGAHVGADIEMSMVENEAYKNGDTVAVDGHKVAAEQGEENVE